MSKAYKYSVEHARQRAVEMRALPEHVRNELIAASPDIIDIRPILSKATMRGQA